MSEIVGQAEVSRDGEPTERQPVFFRKFGKNPVDQKPLTGSDTAGCQSPSGALDFLWKFPLGLQPLTPNRLRSLLLSIATWSGVAGTDCEDRWLRDDSGAGFVVAESRAILGHRAST